MNLSDYRTGLVSRPVYFSDGFHSMPMSKRKQSMGFYKWREGFLQKDDLAFQHDFPKKLQCSPWKFIFYSVFFENNNIFQYSPWCYCPSCCYFFLVDFVALQSHTAVRQLSSNASWKCRGDPRNVCFKRFHTAVHSWIYTPLKRTTGNWKKSKFGKGETSIQGGPRQEL